VLGKDLRGVSADSMLLNERMLYHLNMGYYGIARRSPFASVAYYEAEHNFYHPWSWKSSGKRYGFNKLSEVLPLKDYMSMPMAMLDELLEAVVEGQIARQKAEEEQEDDSDSAIRKEQLAMIKKLGLHELLKK